MDRACLEKPKPITVYSTRENVIGKTPIERSRMRWEYVEKLG